MRVLVIPEDPYLDQYILKPVIAALFDDLGRTPQVEVLQKPRLRGVAQALDVTILSAIVLDNRMIDLFLLVVDRDCDGQRQDAVGALERRHPGKLIACLAVEEVEVWMLALHRDALTARWSEIVGECHPKERFAEPFLVERGWNTSLGRERAMRSLRGQWKTLVSLCPELAALRERVRASVG